MHNNSWGFSESVLHVVLYTLLWKRNTCKDLLAVWETFLYENTFNYDSLKFKYRFAFIPFLSFCKIQNQESNFQQVGGLGPRNISVFCFCQVALYFRGIPSKFNRLSAYFKARNFRGIVNFAGFFFFIIFFYFWEQFLNFSVQPKYYILRHFNFTVSPKYFNLLHFI